MGASGISVQALPSFRLTLLFGANGKPVFNKFIRDLVVPEFLCAGVTAGNKEL